MGENVDFDELRERKSYLSVYSAIVSYDMRNYFVEQLCAFFTYGFKESKERREYIESNMFYGLRILVDMIKNLFDLAPNQFLREQQE